MQYANMNTKNKLLKKKNQKMNKCRRIYNIQINKLNKKQIHKGNRKVILTRFFRMMNLVIKIRQNKQIKLNNKTVSC